MTADPLSRRRDDAALDLVSRIGTESSERACQHRVRLAGDPLAQLNPDMPTARARNCCP
jgi:hypothetical protein